MTKFFTIPLIFVFFIVLIRSVLEQFLGQSALKNLSHNISRGIRVCKIGEQISEKFSALIRTCNIFVWVEQYFYVLGWNIFKG